MLLRPEVNPRTIRHQLVEGTKQTIPDNAYVLIEVVRNLGLNGTTPGRVITPSKRDSLDKVNNQWHVGAGEIVKNYIYDIRNRRTFYVNPPQPAQPRQVEIVVAEIPSQLANDNATIGIDDIYEPALVNFMLHLSLIHI